MGSVNRRGFLKALLVLPFVPRVLDTVARLDLAPRPALRTVDFNAMLKEFYGGVQVRDLVFKDNPFLEYLRDPVEYTLPGNVLRRRIDMRQRFPVASGFAAWAEEAL